MICSGMKRENEATKMQEILKSENYDFLRWSDDDKSEPIKIKVLQHESTNTTEILQQAS